MPSRTDGRPTFSNNWFTNNEKVWRKLLTPPAGKKGLRYLEVSVFEKGSLLWAFHNVLTHPSSTTVAIDLFDFPGLEARFRKNLKRAGVKRRTEVLVRYSSDKLRGLPVDSFDIIHIDGEREAYNDLRDGVLAWDLLRIGGLGFQAALQKVEDMCPGMCTRVAPYELHWNDDPATGMLFDQRTKARVPLAPAELDLLQRVLAGRVFGKLGVQADPVLPNSPEMSKLRSHLGI